MKKFNLCLFVVCFLAVGGCLRPAQIKKIPIDSKAKPATRYFKPVKNIKVLSHFGPRGKSFHTGIDIRGKRGGGDGVYASRRGRVVFVGKKRGYGKMIVIKHPDGIRTRYAHLKKIFVKKNQRVKAKEKIGLVGQTGRATSAHLHFEILTKKGRFADPRRFLFP